MIIEKRQYIAKIELGKMISCIIDEEHIPELCLNKEKQEALLEFRRRQNSPIVSYCQLMQIDEHYYFILNNYVIFNKMND